FGPLDLFVEDLGAAVDFVCGVEQRADVDRADDQEEAGAHHHGENAVDDFDDVLPPSPDVEEHPSLAVCHCSRFTPELRARPWFPRPTACRRPEPARYSTRIERAGAPSRSTSKPDRRR